MRKPITVIMRSLTAISLSLFIAVSSQAVESDSLVSQITECATTKEDTQRIECYEALGQAVLQQSASPEREAVVESSQEPSDVDDSDAKLPESLGGGQFADKAGVKVQTNRGHVTSCKKASDRKWFYIFESGQVWKQVDSRKRRHKDCDFMVTIVKDAFGYKMHIDGQESKIRIDRRR